MSLKNVDGLHQKALKEKAEYQWGPSRLQNEILELHGTLHVWLFILFLKTRYNLFPARTL